MVNLFGHCLENMKKSFVYITLSYCFKESNLTIIIDEKGVASSKKKVAKPILNPLES